VGLGVGGWLLFGSDFVDVVLFIGLVMVGCVVVFVVGSRGVLV